MNCTFKISVNTDGDFCLPFVPAGMEDGGERYYFRKTYEDKDNAIKDIINICTFLKNIIYTDRDYVKEMWYECIDAFIDSLRKSKQYERVYECIGGNYDETYFDFYPKPECFECKLYLTDEEYEIIHKNNTVTNVMIKEAILNLYKNNIKENNNDC